MLRNPIFSLMALFAVTFMACEQLELATDDTQLISAIESADLIDVAFADLPGQTQQTLSIEYADYVMEAAQLAPELGYAVTLSESEDSVSTRRSRLCFSLEGRMLRGDSTGRPGKGRKLKKRKIGERKADKCFDFVYPLTFVMPDGSTLTGDDKGTLDSLIKDWYRNNPTATGRPTLDYPVSIILSDSSVVSIASDSVLKEQASACDSIGNPRGKGRNKLDCFTYVYPLTFVMPDSSTVTGDDRREVGAAIRAWYAANPGANSKPVLQYPYSVTLASGQVVVINNQTDLETVKSDCQ